MTEPAVIYPLLGALYRSVVEKCDFAVHIAGQTGSGKSELAALIQQHFGADLDARNLPASWSSTANALEGSTFLCKDAVLVIDDFCPAGTKLDIDKLNQVAERVIRGAGNNSARQRMNQKLELRPPRPPRGLILSTGEVPFTGHSLTARTITIEVEPGTIDFERLGQSQKAAAEGTFAAIMSTFLKWLAPRLDDVRKDLKARIAARRNEPQIRHRHGRTGDNESHLLFGWDLFLRFAVEIGGLSALEAVEWKDQGSGAIGALARQQSELQSAVDPLDRYLELLKSAFASQQCQLQSADGKWSEQLVVWGWKDDRDYRERQNGHHIGWLEDDDVYLLLDAMHAAVVRMARQTGETLPWSAKTLCKRLKERGLLKSCDAKRGRNTVRRTLGEKRCEVLHFDAKTIAAGEYVPNLVIPREEPLGPSELDYEDEAETFTGVAVAAT